MGHPASVPSHEPGRFPSPGPEPHGSALHGSALDGSVEAPTVSRLLYFSGAGLTVVHLLLFGLIVQAVFDAVDDPRRANLVISVTTQMEHVITACLMIAGVLLYRTAPIRRRLIATGIVVLFPVLSVGVHFLQGVISSSLGLAPGAASTTLILIAAAASTFAQVLCLLTAWNVVAGRPMSVHIIALCGAVGLTLPGTDSSRDRIDSANHPSGSTMWRIPGARNPTTSMMMCAHTKGMIAEPGPVTRDVPESTPESALRPVTDPETRTRAEPRAL